MKIKRNAAGAVIKTVIWLLISVMLLGVFAACEPSVPLDDFTSEEPTEAEPTPTEPADTEPEDTEPEETEPQEPEPADTEPVEMGCVATGHVFGEWHSVRESTCTDNGVERRECENCDYFEEHSVAVKGHTYDANNICSVCQFCIRLDTPVIDRIEDDVVHWIAVDHADMYLVRVNGDYEYKTRSTSCELSSVKNSEGKAIGVSASKKAPVQIKVQVMALVSGQYAGSEWSEVDSSYTYVPNFADEDKVTTLTGYKIGYGYNLIEDEYLRITNASKLGVFDVSKLLSLSRYNVTPNAAGGSTYYSYSSVDEFISKNEAGFDVSMNVKIPMAGTLKTHMNYAGSEHFKEYAYNQTFVADVAVTVEDHELLDLRDEYLQYCLSFDFLDVLNRRTPTTEHMSDEELAAYIYENYGTHVILGVTTGGSYTAQYTVSTNEEAIAEKLKKVVETGVNVNFDDIFGVDIGVNLNASNEKNWKTQTTEAHFNTRFTGSTGGATFDPSPSSLSSAVKEWQSKISPTSVRFTKNGAISMASLIRAVDNGLADVFEAYVEERSDETYREMYGLYEKNLTRLISAPVVENGKNVIYVDLSSFQRSGSMENAYDPNFLENILTVYPVMYGVKIDKIVICGGFDKATGQQNLLDGFSVKLSYEWNRDIEFVVENLGVICASDYGLVDTSAITKNIHVTVNYSGVNMIRETDGEYHFHAQDGDKYYEFYFDPSDVDDMEFSTVDMENGRLSIPIANRINYSFMGWYAGDTQVTDATGALLSSYTVVGERVTLKAKWDAVTYTVTLNDQSATVPGTERFYEKYGVGFFTEFANGSPVSQITIPSRKGYVFGGYYASVSANATINATGDTLCVNEKGEIIRDSRCFTENTMLYALWKPAVYTITLDNAEATNAGSTVYYQRYGEGVYLDEDCTQTGNIEVPTKPGYSFAGYYVSVTDNNTTNAVGDILCIDASGVIVADNQQFTQNTTLIALWTKNAVITLNHEEASSSGLSVLYLQPEGGVYEDISFVHRIDAITIPTKKGYIFGGYYERVIDNNQCQAKGDKQIIDPYGVINAAIDQYTESIELHALWILDTMNKQYSSRTVPSCTETTFLWDIEALQAAGCTGFKVTVLYTAENLTESSWFTFPYQTKVSVVSKSDSITISTGHSGLYTQTYLFEFLMPIDQLMNRNQLVLKWENGVALAEWMLKEAEISITAVSGEFVDVNYDSNNGSSTEARFKIFGQAYGSLPTPKRTGYTFNGWYLNDELITADSIVSTKESHTLVARWTPNTYSIVYDANGGTGSMDPTDCTYGQATNLRANNFTRHGWSFAGWNTNADGSGTAYSNEESVKNVETSGTVTLYAQWTLITSQTRSYGTELLVQGLVPKVKGGSWEGFFDYDGLIEQGYTRVNITYSFDYGYVAGECDAIASLEIGTSIDSSGTVIDGVVKHTTPEVRVDSTKTGLSYTATNISTAELKSKQYIVLNFETKGTWILDYGNNRINVNNIYVTVTFVK